MFIDVLFNVICQVLISMTPIFYITNTLLIYNLLTSGELDGSYLFRLVYITNKDFYH